MALLKKQEALCIELGNKDSRQRAYGKTGWFRHLIRAAHHRLFRDRAFETWAQVRCA